MVKKLLFPEFVVLSFLSSDIDYFTTKFLQVINSAVILHLNLIISIAYLNDLGCCLKGI
jgi:hypothetical protein